MSNVGSPQSAHQLAVALRTAAAGLDAVSDGSRAAGAQAVARWQGQGEAAFAASLQELERQLGDAGGELAELAAEFDRLGYDLEHARHVEAAAKTAELAGDALLVASVIQLGLDPATDAGAAAGRGAAAVAAAAARRVVETAVARLARSIAQHGVRATAIRGLTRFVLPHAALGGAFTAAQEAAMNGGRVSAGSVAEGAVWGVIIPPRKPLGFGHEVAPQVRRLGRPLGFRTDEQFQQFTTRLHHGLREAGHEDVVVVFKGSSVTGVKYTTGAAFDAGRRSDFDIALCSPALLAKAKAAGASMRSGGARTGQLRWGHIQALGLEETAQELASATHREVHFMVYGARESALGRGPSLEIGRR